MLITEINEDDKRLQIEGNADLNYPNVDFLNVNMFVEAGAGAGKTTLIVKRIVNQLQSGVEPGEIVVITFTNAAAEELRGRIADKVRKAGLTKALEHLDEMNISTIHSFCNVLLKEQSILAGLPQNMELMEQDENMQLQRKYFKMFMSKLTHEDWDELERDAKQDEARWSIKQDLADLYEQIVDLPEDTKILTPKCCSVVSDILNQKKEIVENIAQMLFESAKSLLNEHAPAAKKKEFLNLTDFKEDPKLPGQKAKDFVTAYNASAVDEDAYYNKVLDVLLENGKFFKASGLTVTYKKDKEQVESVENRLQEYIEQQIGELRGWLPKQKSQEEEKGRVDIILDSCKKEKHYRCLLKYAEKARRFYRTERPMNKISNDNLLEYTKNLICSDKDTRALEFFSKKYKHFYVDEFQDTDRIQEAFIYRLASDLSDSKHIKLRDGALFVVGDPKQSIYRFRGAQPQVYFDVKDRMSAASMTNCYVYELQRNYRSNEAVIQWVNEKFQDSDDVMPIVDSKHKYQKMQAIKKVASAVNDKEKIIHGIYRYQKSDATYMDLVLKKSKGKDEDSKEEYVAQLVKCEDTKENDIQAVVNLILNLKKNGYTITRYDENNNFEPYADPIQFKDFLLISQDKKLMVEYLEVLKSYGIPVRFDGEASLSTDKVLNTFVRIFWYLVNPKEPFHRMAAKEAIRVSGLADEEAKLEEYTNMLLDHLYEASKKMSAFGKAEFLEKQWSALLDKNRNYGIIEMYTIQTRLRQMLEFVFQNMSGTGVEMAQAFEEYLAKGVEHELSIEEDPDAVRFMNLHKTKGLEGEIVIILDRRGHKKRGVSSMRDADSFYPGIPMRWSSVSGISMYEDKNRKEEDAEFHRLEYVAVTRAKQAVIFMNTLVSGGIFATSGTKIDKETEKESSGYNYHLDQQPSVEDIIDSYTNVLAVPQMKEAYNLQKEEFGNNKKGTSINYQSFYQTINPSKLEKASSSAKRNERKNNEEQLKAAGLYKIEEQKFARPSGNILGNVLHRTMELLVDRYDSSIVEEKAVRALTDFSTRQAVSENMQDIKDKEEADRFEEYVQKAAYAYYNWLTEQKLLDNVANIYTELPFSYFNNENEARDWMHGTADLILAYEDGSVLLIDYKSDNDFLISEDVMEKSFQEKYGPQLIVYRQLICKMFQVKDEQKIEAKIISFSMKDENGNKLLDDKLRVRATNLSFE